MSSDPYRNQLEQIKNQSLPHLNRSYHVDPRLTNQQSKTLKTEKGIAVKITNTSSENPYIKTGNSLPIMKHRKSSQPNHGNKMKNNLEMMKVDPVQKHKMETMLEINKYQISNDYDDRENCRIYRSVNVGDP